MDLYNLLNSAFREAVAAVMRSNTWLDQGAFKNPLFTNFPCLNAAITTSAIQPKKAYVKKKKTYYVRVRAYKADSTGSKVYGSYSKTRKIKV